MHTCSQLKQHQLKLCCRKRCRVWFMFQCILDASFSSGSYIVNSWNFTLIDLLWVNKLVLSPLWMHCLKWAFSNNLSNMLNQWGPQTFYIINWIAYIDLSKMSVLYAWNVHEVLLFISKNIYKNAICCGSKVYDIHCTIDLCIRLTIMEKENKL